MSISWVGNGTTSMTAMHTTAAGTPTSVIWLGRNSKPPELAWRSWVAPSLGPQLAASLLAGLLSAGVGSG
jgi:hypothetical protein